MAAYGFDASNWGYGLKAPRKAMFEKSIMGEYFHIFRAFWRSHMCAVDGSPALLECPDTCDAAEIAAALGIDLNTAAAAGATTAAGSTSTSGASGSGEPPQSAFTTAVAGQIIDRCACTVTKLMDGTTTWQNVYPCVVATTKQV